jgi:hypothetical protein
VPPNLLFGLDTLRSIDSIIVEWPSFKKQVIKNPVVNTRLVLKEADAVAGEREEPGEGPVLFREVTNLFIKETHVTRKIILLTLTWNV